tara:strand:+ start:703 stop:1434 length:732 start_codon:yes stop_codon:yes gene_type:complete
MKNLNQNHDLYTKDDFWIWNKLYTEQTKNLINKSCIEFHACLKELETAMNSDKIPKFTKLNKLLKRKNGWTINVVPGLISAEEFFRFLSKKKFCSSTWLRSKDQLKYLSEPDMFHDTYGHIPLLMDKGYSSFTQKLGEIGTKYAKHPKALAKIQKLYWFTIEFGMMIRKGDYKIYGAGILSSLAESKKIFSKNADIRSFDLEKVINSEYDISKIQPYYYAIQSFEQLYQSLFKLEEILARDTI